ncbi:MAG: hypothetical protein OXI08_09395 [Cyanobacteria bacterium MAG IRC4_bin_6]|nr:hypothetical protein [Cyanobacteria bacterium MAG IRC4_bin_6]
MVGAAAAARMTTAFHTAFALAALLAFLGGCGGGQLPQAKPLPSGCLAAFDQESLGSAEHMALCDHIVASHPRLLRAHVDRFIVWQHYGRELEACRKLFEMEKTMATLTSTPDDQEDFRFSVEVVCRQQGGDG